MRIKEQETRLNLHEHDDDDDDDDDDDEIRKVMHDSIKKQLRSFQNCFGVVFQLFYGEELTDTFSLKVSPQATCCPRATALAGPLGTRSLTAK